MEKSHQHLIDYILHRRALSHLIFFGGFFGIVVMLAALNSGEIIPHLINYSVMLPAQILATYALVYWLAPKELLLKKRYLEFGLLFCLSAYLFSAMARIGVVHVAEPFTRTDFEQETILEILTDPFYLFSIYFPSVYQVPFIFLLIKNVKDRFDERHQLEVLQKEKATTELKFLKAQIHPHFLFNTLNSLYALTLEQSPKAADVVLKLSEMLDHILYQSGEKEVPISQELKLIQHYIDLESLRYEDKLNINFQQEIDDSSTKIAPLILLSIIENAFKHGVSGAISEAEVKINLQLASKKLRFEVFNTKPSLAHQNPIEKEGIGAENIKRQLALIYPKSHQITIEDREESYLLILEINLP